MKRILKTGLVITAAVLMTVSFAACSGKQSKIPMTPGTYTGMSLGRKGEIKVEVVVEAESIVSVKVVQQRETPIVSDESIVKIPADIVEYQTVNVDTCTGASFTGNAIKGAVMDAIEQAGGNVDDYYAKADYPKVKSSTEKISCDYAVVGAGLSGLMSSYKAAKAGYDVVVFEKMSFVGGAMHCAAGVVAGAGSSIYEGDPNGKYSSPEAYAADRWAKQNIKTDNPEEWTPETTPLSYLMHKENLAMTNELIERGVEFARPVKSISHVLKGGYFKNTSAFAGWLEDEAESVGVTFVKNAEVTQIKTENGKVTGLVAVSGEKTYEVTSTGVLLAAGGWNSNAEMVAEYYPEYDHPATSSFYTADGASIRLAEQAGGTVTGMELGFSQLWITAKSEIEIPFFSFYNKSILVDANGKRFANEYSSYRDHCDKMMKDPQYGGYGYFVWDETENEIIQNGSEKLRANPTLDEGMIGTGYKSLYELNDVVEYADAAAAAAAMELPALAETIARYNGDAEAGNPDEFGRWAPMVAPLKGKIYVMKIKPSIYVSYGGVQVDEGMRVLDASGNGIEGLYASGDAIGAPERQEGMKYTAGVTVAMSFGKVAAETFAADFPK